MQSTVEERFKISPYLVFFLIHKIQMGVGVLTFQAEIVKWAGNDAWISIIISGLYINILIWMMYRVLNKEKTDIISINKNIFGKWLGNIFNIFLLVYFLLISIVVISSYFEVIHVWMFPKVSLLSLCIIFIPLFYYIVEGGFRIVTGICFFGVMLPLYLILTLLFPLEFAHYDNLLPIFHHSINEIMLSAKQMSLSYIGFSTLFIYYPFIKNPEKSQKWAQVGVAFSIFLYLATYSVSIVFYSEEQLKTTLWPTLDLWKIIEMPFVERFEYIGISSWALVILPNITLAFWAFMRGAKRVFGVKQRKALLFSLFVTLLVVPFIKTHNQIQLLEKSLSFAGYFVFFGYIPFIFISHFIYSKVKKNK
ncbi:GerAB/ArcD/ProY family transporter [Neobacillus ginsengisoli]|uniref:Spore germination protein (Amino acid permease) n=1 Tax=Neobacillus ginsengisoli TaxID=904295 RepID=A0ABT9XV66_9BACI|nr:GerAB/ArcD/ProY family transporter [Neobacillus ginsengisoli]MDQ0199474.1 spore germination protein (amino acid permease) [Neobacillus ginsengisoli]